ncbi:hypothetical protein RIO-1_42 [Pseudoalteromonas phage RIO-1]|uniref:Uncharacterized protein n=1 Tax=Pseudoalteromonas phage RIO-1 TaxID=1316739 RepID=R4JGV7_9CAUD|nr:hypothetical protein RIO-1_42 [Pseudoalteromonas phage RIO-1]AGK87056.1 hypothetical protein RIO-1_42 [Pseudoalteromonas phage RIO-1]
MINDSLLSVTGGDLISYLNGTEGTATSVNQAWMDYLTREGYTTGTLNDRLYNKLRDDGFTGTLADMLTGFWSTPPVNYVARLDGATQYWQLSEPIQLVGNYKVDIEMSADAGNQLSMKVTDGQGLVESKRVDTNLVNYFFDPRDYMHIEVNGVETREAPSNGESFMLSLIRSEQEANRADKEVYILGARFTQSNHLKGYIKSIKVYDANDALTHEIPLTNKDQGAFQVATTTPLGENLYTQEVIESPLFAMDQWSYLGDGRWQLIGDGSANTVQFLSGFDQPESGYIQFEIESITGSTITCTQNASAGSVFSTAGVKTFYYNSKSEIQSIQFKRSTGAVQAVIKNIKHFNADGVLIATMPNYTEAVWKKESEL